MSDILWTNPDGYQRTSRLLQGQYLHQLIERGKPTGRILDVGCGTGNAIPLIVHYGKFVYTGIDKSAEMLAFARTHSSTHVKFINDDFLETKSLIDCEFDHIICAACLHWLYPRHKESVVKMRGLLRSKGYLHLSTAASFAFLPGEDQAQREVALEVRKRFKPVKEISTFDSRRLDATGILETCIGFNIEKVSSHEEWLFFSNYDDFRDWHVGSGSVIYSQFSPVDQRGAVELYYQLLYERYSHSSYRVPYGTTLLTLRRDT